VNHNNATTWLQIVTALQKVDVDGMDIEQPTTAKHMGWALPPPRKSSIFHPVALQKAVDFDRATRNERPCPKKGRFIIEGLVDGTGMHVLKLSNFPSETALSSFFMRMASAKQVNSETCQTMKRPSVQTRVSARKQSNEDEVEEETIPARRSSREKKSRSENPVDNNSDQENNDVFEEEGRDVEWREDPEEYACDGPERRHL